MKLSDLERTRIVETLKNIKLEYEELSKEIDWFTSESPELIETCLEILGETKNKR